MADSLKDLAADFADPADEYGPVPLWWLDGDELDDDRLTEQMEALAANGVPAVCFISKLPNGPDGTDPQYFTDEWWSHMEHITAECERLGMDLWVHDQTYHHSPPTWWEFWQDHIRTEATENEGVRGRVLAREATDVEHGEAVTLELPRDFEPVSVGAYPRADDGSLLLEERVPLDVEDGRVEWPGRSGEWHVAAIGHRPEGLCYTRPETVERYIDLHYEEYVRRLGDRVGDALVGTFEDELRVLDDEVPYDERVLDRFREEHDYDPSQDLIALYEECAETTRLRTDYYDVVVSLLEENWFQPLYKWHEEHDLDRAHDNWGRNNIAAGTEQYGDYYSTMRWYQAPGYDDGGPEAIGDRNFFDAKLSASIAACYDRDRVWGELFHSTTWGFRPDSQLAGLVENVCYGCNLYDKHGCYYTTLGGWWAHAPPDVHFRQPYWDDVGELNDASRRLSRLFSDGTPVVDVALAFPVATMHADWNPETGVGDRGDVVDERTRELTASLYERGVDLVLADDDSLKGAAADGSLSISGMDIPALVLPPTTAIRAKTLEAALELYESGGVVVASGRLPTSVGGGESENVGDGGEREDGRGDGDDDTDLDSALRQLFGDGYERAQAGTVETRTTTESDAGGVATLLPPEADVADVVTSLVDRDVRADAPDVYHAHRTVADGDAEAYLLFNARDEARTVEVDLRATGSPELWDPLTGETEPLYEFKRDGGYTRAEFDFSPHGFRVVMIETEADALRIEQSDVDVAAVDDGTVHGYATRDGEARVQAVLDSEVRTGHVDRHAPTVLDVSEGWSFDLDPTLDNEWGDFRYPPNGDTIGAEVKQFDHRRERPDEDGIDLGWHRAGVDVDGDEWETTTPTNGPEFYRTMGSASDDPAAPPADLTGWEPYEFSEAVGKPGTHPYLLGYMSTVSDSYIVSPALDAEERAEGTDATYFWTTVRVPERGTYLCHFGPGVADIRLGDRTIQPRVEDAADYMQTPDTPGDGDTVSVQLPAGQTAVLLTVKPGVETYFAMDPAPGTARERDMTYVPRVRWFHGEGQGEATFDPRPDEDSVGWYRFEVPVGTAAFSVPVRGDPCVWVDGAEHPVDGGRVSLDEPVADPTEVAVRVDHAPGAYGGAAWEEPVTVETATVTVDAGDWRDLGLRSYSGRAVYSRSVSLPEFDENDRVVLDLGDVVAAASVTINGDHVGHVFTRPFRIDVTDVARPGANRVEVRVANTLANHFADETPRDYHDIVRTWVPDGEVLPEAKPENQYDGGLRGPVTVRVERGVTVDLTE